MALDKCSTCLELAHFGLPPLLHRSLNPLPLPWMAEVTRFRLVCSLLVSLQCGFNIPPSGPPVPSVEAKGLTLSSRHFRPGPTYYFTPSSLWLLFQPQGQPLFPWTCWMLSCLGDFHWPSLTLQCLFSFPASHLAQNSSPQWGLTILFIISAFPPQQHSWSPYTVSFFPHRTFCLWRNLHIYCVFVYCPSSPTRM